MSLLRSLLFTTPLIVISTIVMGTLSLIASFFDRTGNSQHAIARVWARILLAASLIRVRVEGVEQLDPNATYVFVSNHQSLMDIPAILCTLPYQFRFFAKKGLYQIPFIGTHLRRAGHLPVDRSSARASLKSMTEGAHIISQAASFPYCSFPRADARRRDCASSRKARPTSRSRPGCPSSRSPSSECAKSCRWVRSTSAAGKVAVRIGEPIPTTGMTSPAASN